MKNVVKREIEEKNRMDERLEIEKGLLGMP